MQTIRNNFYYTAGELADMFQIPKQTLLYYDKVGLLKPEYISQNNYRHYSISQYMTLEIIISLRKLDISITDIKEYLDHPSAKLLQNILSQKQAILQEKIKAAQSTCTKIDNLLVKISHASHTHTDAILLEHRHKQKLIITRVEDIKDSKKIISIYASHNINSFDNKETKDKSTGWIISKSDYFDHGNYQSKAYYSLMSDSYEEENCQLLPSGLYLTVQFKGTFHTEGIALREKLLKFLEANELEVIGDVYCMPLKDHWLTNSPNEYISRLSMHVKYKNEKML